MLRRVAACLCALCWFAVDTQSISSSTDIQHASAQQPAAGMWARLTQHAMLCSCSNDQLACPVLYAEYGDALAPVDKMRLFMSYLATHPEKLDPTKKQQWAKLARLDAQDMDTVCNLAYLNVAVMKQPGSQVGRWTKCKHAGM